jgi:hypothetical protein
MDCKSSFAFIFDCLQTGGSFQGRGTGSNANLVYRQFQIVFYVQEHAYIYETFTRCYCCVSCLWISLLNITPQLLESLKLFKVLEAFTVHAPDPPALYCLSKVHVMCEQMDHKEGHTKGISETTKQIFWYRQLLDNKMYLARNTSNFSPGTFLVKYCRGQQLTWLTWFVVFLSPPTTILG